MSNILYLTASIRSDADSISRGLGERLVDGLAARNGASVTTCSPPRLEAMRST
jgi:FMN-dependent NADH-azoreductase